MGDDLQDRCRAALLERCRCRLRIGGDVHAIDVDDAAAALARAIEAAARAGAECQAAHSLGCESEYPVEAALAALRDAP